MSKPSSLDKRERNRQIRTRMALGESPKVLAEDYGLSTATISAITKGYKDSGYEFNQEDYPSADLAALQNLILSNGLDIHISTFIDRLVEVKKARGPFVSQFNEMFQLYQNSDPGTTTAQVALLQISYIVNKLLHFEFQISSTLASIQAIRSSLSTVQRYKPCAKTSKK